MGWEVEHPPAFGAVVPHTAGEAPARRAARALLVVQGETFVTPAVGAVIFGAAEVHASGHRLFCLSAVEA